MKKFVFNILAAASLAALASCMADTTEHPSTAVPERDILTEIPSDACEGILLVKFEPYVCDILETARAATRTSGAALTRSGVLTVDEVLNIIGAFDIERVFPMDVRHEARTREAELHTWYAVRFDEEISIAEAARRLSALGEVETLNFNRKLKRAYNPDRRAIPLPAETLEAARSMRTRASSDELPFNDVLFKYQWDIVNRGVLYDHDGNIVKADGSTPDSKYDTYEDTGVIAGADVQCEKAWERSTGDQSIIVAILDEGVAVEHPDLAASMWHNDEEIYRSYDDNDSNGYAGDYYGYNFARNSGVISTDDQADTGHGTHVAGVIAAQNNNGIGIASIAGGDGIREGVKIMSCQIFSGNYVASVLDEVRAIKYAADNGAVILQCSWGYMSSAANPFDWGYGGSYETDEEWALYNPLEKSAFDYFTHNAGSPNGVIDGGLAIFAGGNEYAPAAGYPGAYGQHISVAATAADYTPAVYTNYGTGITISAPGGDYDYYGYLFRNSGKSEDELNEGKNGTPGAILSTLPYNVSESGYGYMEGTSMACPHVSGVAALGLSYAVQLRKHFTAAEYRELLVSTADPLDDLLSGTKRYYKYVTDLNDIQTLSIQLGDYKGKMGSGQINAARLLEAVAGSGRDLRMPNLYVPLDGSVTIVPSFYFENGRSQSYTLTVADTAIASGEYANGKLTVTGKAEGITRAAVKADSGEEQSFTITVRKAAGSNGWM